MVFIYTVNGENNNYNFLKPQNLGWEWLFENTHE